MLFRPLRLAYQPRQRCSALILTRFQTNQAATSSSQGSVASAAARKSEPGSAAPRRFWKSVSIASTDDNQGFFVQLDGRNIKTPLGKPLRAPTQSLASLIALEWDMQDKVLKPHSLPLTSVVARSMDAMGDLTERERVADFLLKYLDTDTICYHQEFPEALANLQEKHWSPILNWFEREFGTKVNTTNGIMGIRQSDELKTKMREQIMKMSPLELAGFERAVIASKSFVIALAMMRDQISIKEAANAARVETLSQIERWGMVEDSHDVDAEDLLKQLGSAMCFTL